MKSPCTRTDSTHDEICAKRDLNETETFSHLMEKTSQRNTYYYYSCAPLSNLWDKQSKVIAKIPPWMKSVQNITKMRWNPFRISLKKILIEIIIILTHTQRVKRHRFHIGCNLCETGPRWDKTLFAFNPKTYHRSTYCYSSSEPLSNLLDRQWKKFSHRFHGGWNMWEIGPIWEQYIFTSKCKSA
jgi:hypothetical protein